MTGQQYISIPLSALAQGKHEFDFEIKDDFFSKFQPSEVKKGNVFVELDLEKFSSYILLELRFDGFVTVDCDRCLEEVEISVTGENTFSVRLVEDIPDEVEQLSMEDDILYANPNDEKLDIDNYCYESICLALPIQRVHPNDKNGKSLCNPEMLKYLSGQFQENPE